MPSKPTLLIDFDGTIHKYIGWNGGIIQGPLEKARHSMHILAAQYRLILFTTRTNTEELRAWLLRHGFPPMKVTNIKEPAHLIIDDRALTFEGAWTQEFLNRITSFRPHWEASHEAYPDTQCPASTEPLVSPNPAPTPPDSDTSRS